MKDYTNPEPPDMLSTQDTIVDLCSNEKSRKVLKQCTATNKAGNVSSNTTDRLAMEVLSNVPLSEVAF